MVDGIRDIAWYKIFWNLRHPDGSAFPHNLQAESKSSMTKISDSVWYEGRVIKMANINNNLAAILSWLKYKFNYPLFSRFLVR